MVSLLLAIIYLAFISLGLPDSLLGSAWPVMRLELGVPISYAGIVSMTIAAGIIIVNAFENRYLPILKQAGKPPVQKKISFF